MPSGKEPIDNDSVAQCQSQPGEDEEPGFYISVLSEKKRYANSQSLVLYQTQDASKLLSVSDRKLTREVHKSVP